MRGRKRIGAIAVCAAPVAFHQRPCRGTASGDESLESFLLEEVALTRFYGNDAR